MSRAICTVDLFSATVRYWTKAFHRSQVTSSGFSAPLLSEANTACLYLRTRQTPYAGIKSRMQTSNESLRTSSSRIRRVADGHRRGRTPFPLGPLPLGFLLRRRLFVPV